MMVTSTCKDTALVVLVVPQKVALCVVPQPFHQQCKLIPVTATGYHGLSEANCKVRHLLFSEATANERELSLIHI